MNLQEQINRIQEMMGIIKENEGGSVSIISIPRSERKEKKDLIKEIAIACYGTPERAEFSDKFSPDKVSDNKVLTFTNHLFYNAKDLWVVKYGDETVGFFIVTDDIPFKNSIGFGINVEYSGKGIMTKAFELVKQSGELKYPLYGYTFKSNEASKKLMTKMGFVLRDEIEYKGNTTLKFEFTPDDYVSPTVDKDVEYRKNIINKDIEDKKNKIDSFSFYSDSNEENNRNVFELGKKHFIDDFISEYFSDSDKETKRNELLHYSFKKLDDDTQEKWHKFINSLRD